MLIILTVVECVLLTDAVFMGQKSSGLVPVCQLIFPAGFLSVLFQRWVHLPWGQGLWSTPTKLHCQCPAQSDRRFYEWSHLRDTTWSSCSRTEFVNHEDFINQRIESTLIRDCPIRETAVAKECNHFGENFILSGCESVSEFIHALSIPQIHHEWKKYVPVHELDSSCKKSGRPCDSWTTGHHTKL